MAVCKTTFGDFVFIFMQILDTLKNHIEKSTLFFSIVKWKKIICIKNRYYAADSVN